MPSVTFLTFGCKVNQYDSQALRERSASRGLVEVPADREADHYVLNTCTVTEAAAEEALREARRIRREHPFAEITVTGCAADTHADAFAPLGRVVPTAAKATLFEDPRLASGDLLPSIFDLQISAFEGHTRAFLKVEDGCDLNCSFCIIPRVRGRARSRSVASAVEEARRLLDRGHRELVLSGVHLGAWGKDLPGRPRLAELAARLLELPGLGRLRLSSLEAPELDDALLDLMASDPRFCPHLHLPLQSGDAGVLRAMRRRYSPAQFLETCDRIRARLHDPAISTDVIAGFPGETEAAFENTLELCRRAGIARLHAFSYSRRRGTDAAARPELPPRVKKERARRLRALGDALAADHARSFVGREVEVLAEADGTGWTERYVRVRTGAPRNALFRARGAAVRGGVLLLDGPAQVPS